MSLRKETSAEGLHGKVNNRRHMPTEKLRNIKNVECGHELSCEYPGRGGTRIRKTVSARLTLHKSIGEKKLFQRGGREAAHEPSHKRRRPD